MQSVSYLFTIFLFWVTDIRQQVINPTIIKFLLIFCSPSFFSDPAFPWFFFYACSIKQAFIITLSFVK